MKLFRKKKVKNPDSEESVKLLSQDSKKYLPLTLSRKKEQFLAPNTVNQDPLVDETKLKKKNSAIIGRRRPTVKSDQLKEQTLSIGQDS